MIRPMNLQNLSASALRKRRRRLVRDLPLMPSCSTNQEHHYDPQ
jgi:hypothetical protein